MCFSLFASLNAISFSHCLLCGDFMSVRYGGKEIRLGIAGTHVLMHIVNLTSDGPKILKENDAKTEVPMSYVIGVLK